MLVIYIWYQYRGNISSQFSSNSDADASKLLENLEEMFLRYYMNISMLTSPTTHDSMWLRIWICSTHHYACSTKETFLQDFPVIPKYLLRNFSKNLNVFKKSSLWNQDQWSFLISTPFFFKVLSFTEFGELLNMVHCVPLYKSDPLLISLHQMPISWYTGLAKLLIAKYQGTSRLFSSQDNLIKYVVSSY